MEKSTVAGYRKGLGIAQIPSVLGWAHWEVVYSAVQASAWVSYQF